MRDIKYIMLHCSDTAPGHDVGAEDIDRWHRQQGWQMIGYHYVVRLNGEIETGRPLFMKAAACKKADCNECGIHICYIGGRNAKGETADTRTEQQHAALYRLIRQLRQKFPRAKIVGHRDFDKGKACPCFDADYYNDLCLI